jgi:hypothetical protein
MLLTAFILTQLAFDAILALAGLVVMLRWRARPRGRRAPEAPVWHQESLQLARELLAATESVMQALERRPAPAGPPLPDDTPLPVTIEVTPAEPVARPGLRLVHSVVASRLPHDVGVVPGQQRLVDNIAAARAAAARADD